ncbi:hypothetical protein BSIN_1211 [Burkholderia singularis]|uniref:Uncharacterized protein n=1 Tax=Burkholderia singularis TaxID=1503053 RepID=A0A238HCD0_9BURK|nr:hypothetical protein BSIN_1211 [Burkholderia singularis]
MSDSHAYLLKKSARKQSKAAADRLHRAYNGSAVNPLTDFRKTVPDKGKPGWDYR